MLVQQILKAKSDNKVITLQPDTSVAEAAELLSRRGIGAVIVSDDGKAALGILSERDIVREIGRRGPSCMNEKVGAMMTSDLVGCAPDERSDGILTKMTEGRFRHMPVIVDGQMIGLISIGDVVKARLSELSMEKEALEGMIMGH